MYAVWVQAITELFLFWLTSPALSGITTDMAWEMTSTTTEIPTSTIEPSGSELFSPLNKKQQYIIKHLAANLTGNDRIHTGFHSKYLSGSLISIKGDQFHNTDHWWAAAEPDDNSGRLYPIAVDKHGDEYISDYNSLYPFICYIEKTGDVNSCNTPDLSYKDVYNFNGHCYKYHHNPQEWKHAAGTCVGEGGHLAVINDEGEGTFITELVKLYDKNKYLEVTQTNIAEAVYIGNYKHKTTGMWVTILEANLQEFGTASWSEKEPSGDNVCAYLQKDKLNSIDCERRLPFVCEMPRL